MDNACLFLYTFWTNLPLIPIIYYLLLGILKVKNRDYLYSGVIGLIAYILYMGTILLYSADERLKYFLYIIKIVEPIYIIYLIMVFKSKDSNGIIEALTVILILFFLGAWKYIT